MPARARSLRIDVEELGLSVSALHQRADDEHALLVLAHGAGAGMDHAFMESLCNGLAVRGIATLRYQFPYREAGRRAPDRAPKLVATVRAAIVRGAELADGQRLLAGGKSMGGRMTSLALSDPAVAPPAAVAGIVFVGFPLHPAGKPGEERAAHLAEVAKPMLFLQGTRDGLAELARIERVCEALGRRATLHVVDGADHSFHVLKRSGRTDDEVLDELGDAIASFARAQGDA